MHRSIGGLADAFQSIADGKASLSPKKRKPAQMPADIEHVIEDIAQDIKSNERMSDTNKHYLDMESCTARIAARLRDMDNVDLNHHPQPDIGDAAVSNQMKFIDNQCYRAQALLNGEFYMRNLHSEEVHKNMIELDERITYTAKNWKHSLAEMGIHDNELTALKAPAVEAAEDMRPVESDSKKVRRNSVMTQSRPTMVGVEADYSSYNSAEINELNEIIKQFMDAAFISGSNGVQITNEVMERCNRFKQKVLDLTHQMIEKKKRAIKVSLRVEQKTVRSQESEIALLHAQNEDAVMVIRNQKENDTEIRKLVEAKFAEPLAKLQTHIQGIEDKIVEQTEANVGIQKRFAEVQEMKEALSKQRLFADPFLRRRAENLVKGLLRNLNEKDLKEQEEREEQMQSSYQQWKKVIEVCTDKERQLGLIEAQEKVLMEEIAMQRRRIEEERVTFRDKAKVLTAKDTEQSNKLLILEELMSERARDERRKVHYEHRESIQLNVSKSGKGKSGDEFADSDSVLSGRGTTSSRNRSQHAHPGATSPTSPSSMRDAGSDSDTDTSTSSGSERPSTGQSIKAKQSSRVKQHNLRSVAALCDDYTEGVLGITYEHTKRQEISSEVRDHIPRPAPGYLTGSEASDNALLTKAHKILASVHPAAAAGQGKKPDLKIAVDDAAHHPSATTLAPPPPAPEVEVWLHGTNSAPRSPKGQVKFRTSSGRPRSSADRDNSPLGFWADGENESNSDTEGDIASSGRVLEDGRPRSSKSRKQKTTEVYSLTSTACYVALYSRYLKKFPNLNFKRSNPRLEASEGEGYGTEYMEQSEKKKPSELVKDNNRFQFSVREAAIVIKEALDSLLHCRCVDKIIVTDALEKLAELERRVKASSVPEEEKEVRYQLHFLCVSLIHTTMSRAPRVLLVKNNRKLFVEISTTMLALLGVILNCTLMFWQPSVLRPTSRPNSSAGEGGVAPERVEFICAHLVELALTLGDVENNSAALGGNTRQVTAVTSTKTFRVKKTAETLAGPAGFISLLRTQTSELVRNTKTEEKNKISPTNVHRTSSKSSGGHKKTSINYHDLLQVFNRIVDDDETSTNKTFVETAEFTMKHRHALFSLQLFLYVALGNKDTSIDEAILTLHRGIIDGNNLIRADSSGIIPCDVDILLQQMHPGMVPAMLVLELLRRLLEEEFSRVHFLNKIANADKDVADLQFLNVQFTSQFDVGLRHGRGDGRGSGSVSANSSYLSHVSTAASTVLPELTTIDPRAPAAPPSPRTKLSPHDPLSLVSAESSATVVSRQYPPLHVTRYKTSREVHVQWVEDLEKHLQRLGAQVGSLIRPAGATNTREPSFVTSDLSSNMEEEGPIVTSIPLPDVLVYKILAHVNTLRTVTASRSINGLARVQAVQPAFLQIMRELLAARKRIIAIVTAMTWPLRKKITWLKLKYNTILEDNGSTNEKVDHYRAIVERYQRDIDAFKTSVHSIEKEKQTLEYRRTKILALDHHDPQIQQLIIEHVTDEYSTKYSDFKAREARLVSTIAQLSHEYDHLNAQHDTLRAAQRSLSLIDTAQDTMESELNQSPPRRASTVPFDELEKPLTAEPLVDVNLEVTPKSPPGNADGMSPVDQFIQRERLTDSALRETPKESFSAKQSADRAKELEQQRLQNLRNNNESTSGRLRMPLFGASAKLQSRPEQPSLPPKLFGFAKRIEGGLQDVGSFRGSPTNASQKHKSGSVKFASSVTGASNKLNTMSSALTDASVDSAYSEDLNLGSFMSTAAENFLDGGSSKADIFGQQMPISQKQRAERGFLRKHSSSKKRKGNSTRSVEMPSPFMWNKSGKMIYNHEEVLAGPPPDSPLINDSTLSALSTLSVLSADPPLSQEENATVPSSPKKKPELTLRKSHIFIAGLDRAQPFRYDDIVAHDLRTNFTPLNIRKMIASLQEEQSEELAARRALSSYNDLLPATSAPDTTTLSEKEEVETERERKGFRPGSGMEIDEGDEDEDMYEYEDFDDEYYDLDHEQDDPAEGEGNDGKNEGERRSHKHARGGSSRDQNVGNGVTYAEYLIWKAKRKQQQEGTPQLDALKNSLNIQLRGARKVLTTEGSEEQERTETSLEEAHAETQLEEAATPRDYSKTNSEVNFILSRSSSRAESLAAHKRKASSKRSSGYGSALHFGAAPTTTSGEESAVVEAERRARGENVPSARASLVMRARASLINKLSRTLEAIESNQADPDNPDDFQTANMGSRSARQSVRRSVRQSMLARPLAPIAETARGQPLVRHGSLYTPAVPLPPSETKLEEARIVAHSIIHGRVLDAPKSKLRNSFEKNNPNFDIQILDYIANDHLVIKGWEKVDLLKMNDNETFAGHALKFDEQEDKRLMSTLREFTSQVAHHAEDSANKVESEYKAAILNLNRLVGKKITDTAEIDALAASVLDQTHSDQAHVEHATVNPAITIGVASEAIPMHTTAELSDGAESALSGLAHRPAAVYTQWPCSTDRLDSPEESPVYPSHAQQHKPFDFEHTPSPSPSAHSAPANTNTRVFFAPTTSQDSGASQSTANPTDNAEKDSGPHPPVVPKPSVSFASPHRKSKISESKY